MNREHDKTPRQGRRWHPWEDYIEDPDFVRYVEKRVARPIEGRTA